MPELVAGKATGTQLVVIVMEQVATLEVWLPVEQHQVKESDPELLAA